MFRPICHVSAHRRAAQGLCSLGSLRRRGAAAAKLCGRHGGGLTRLTRFLGRVAPVLQVEQALECARKQHSERTKRYRVKLQDLQERLSSSQQQLVESEAKVAQLQKQAAEAAVRDKQTGSQGNLCVGCSEKQADMAMVPCGHASMCEDCWTKWRKKQQAVTCVTCRKDAWYVVKVRLQGW